MNPPRKAKRSAARLWRLCLIDGRLDEERVRLVVEGLLGARTTGADAALWQFRRLLHLYAVRWSARVESATLLDARARASVEDGLQRRYGHPLTTTFTVNEGLIGGMRLTVGSHVYDGSVRARLDMLDARF